MNSNYRLHDVFPEKLKRRIQKRIDPNRELRLLQNRRTRAESGSINPSIFVAGYFHTGTRWINELIRLNTPRRTLYTLKNLHNYIDDSNRIAEFGKHSELNSGILSQETCIVIYLVRDFETWLQSYLNKPYDDVLDGDVAIPGYGWQTMNVYDLYCHVTTTNVSHLRRSGKNFVIANLGYLKQSKGTEILELLEQQGLHFARPIRPVIKHTKAIERRGVQRKIFEITDYKHHVDCEFEDLIAASRNALEYKFASL